MVCRRGCLVRLRRLKYEFVPMNIYGLLLIIVTGIVFFSSPDKVVLADAGLSTTAENGMVLVPSGEFIMGSTEKDGKIGISVGVDELPQHRLFLKAFHIDKYEVTNRLYKHYVDLTGHKPPIDNPEHEGPYSWKDNFPPGGEEDFPVTNVSWYDADDYCRWAGKRLPAEEEWEKAARGTDARQWPWGNNLNDGECNTKYTDRDTILPAGKLSKDVSPYGAYDMCGNVAEWTSSWYLPYKGSLIKRDDFGEKYRVTRGGSWVMPAIPYSRSAYRANTSSPDYRHRGIGFRCVKDVGEK